MGLASKAGARLLVAVWAATTWPVTTGACRAPGKASETASQAASQAASKDAPLAAPKLSPAPPPRGKLIAILYSSNLLGAYAPCACTLPLGGIARRATVIARARGETDATLVVDAGDLFTPMPEAGESERRARLLATAYVRGGLVAFTPGEHDLALGLPLLRRVIAATGLPVVSANLYGPDGRRLFDADRLVDAGGVKLGVFGVSAPPSPADAARFRAAGVEARDPAAAAGEAVRSLRARGAAVVVALVHVGAPADSRRLVGAVEGIDWAVLGHSGLNLETPEEVGGARLLEAMSEGKNLGRLDLHLVAGSLAFVDRGERDEIAAILEDHRRQLAEYDRPVGDTDPAALLEYRDTRRRQIQIAIDRETALLARLPQAITGSWFDNRVVALDAGTPDEAGVARLVEDYRRRASRPTGHPADR